MLSSFENNNMASYMISAGKTPFSSAVLGLIHSLHCNCSFSCSLVIMVSPQGCICSSHFHTQHLSSKNVSISFLIFSIIASLLFPTLPPLHTTLLQTFSFYHFIIRNWFNSSENPSKIFFLSFSNLSYTCSYVTVTFP